MRGGVVRLSLQRVLFLLNFPKQTVCMRSKDWRCHWALVARPAFRHDTVLAAAPVLFAHAVVTFAKKQFQQHLVVLASLHASLCLLG